jgi:hypothetical protein
VGRRFGVSGRFGRIRENPFACFGQPCLTCRAGFGRRRPLSKEQPYGQPYHDSGYGQNGYHTQQHGSFSGRERGGLSERGLLRYGLLTVLAGMSAAGYRGVIQRVR